MSEETPKHPKAETPNIEKVSTPAPTFTNEQLIKLLIDQQRETAKAYEKLGEALLESRKPYVDPAVLKAKQLELEERRRQVALEWRKRVATKRQCRHMRTQAGLNGELTFIEGKYNIKWHEHSNGIVTGVCGTCFSQFDTRNPEDRKLAAADGTSYNKRAHSRGIATS